MVIIKHAVRIFLIFLFCVSGYAQNELNPFKYIIVPKKYDFLKEENQYRVNSITKYLFEQEGFETFYQGDDYPEDLNANPCLALTAIVVDDSGMFTTKLFIALKDCRDKEVYRTSEGRSKIKEFDKTYIDAIKKSFVSIENLNHSFDESLVINAGAISTMNQTSKKSNSAVSSADVQQTGKVMDTSTETTPVPSKKAEEVPAATAVVPVVETKEPEVQKLQETVPAENKASEVSPAAVAVVPVVAPKETKETESQKTSENIVAEQPVETEKSNSSNQLSGGARAFKNDKTTFLLVDQGTQMQAYVSESKNQNYKPGELIGTFKKTSLPNVFRVSWKKPIDGVVSTTAYFDDKGNLKIDIETSDRIEVLSFTEVK